MAFLIFGKVNKLNKTTYINLNEKYKLAGYGLIFQLWNKKGKLKNYGWTLDANELLKQHDANMSTETHSLVIDFHPKSNYRIGLIEIEKVHLYTYGDEKSAWWTAMMLEIRDVYYDEGYKNLSQEEKAEIISEFEVDNNRKQHVEFLYLNGDEYYWNWGRNGMTNAAFIGGEARKYFQNFFLLSGY